MAPGHDTTDRWVRRRRPPRAPRSPTGPVELLQETERDRLGLPHRASTVFLTGAECPFSCVFCDLWQHTLDTPTPPGVIPSQLDDALQRIDHRDCIKLYNASSFFDARAVPPSDDTRLLQQLNDFERVVVECHPWFVGPRCFSFADRLSGQLEVAIGLETVHPQALARLNKQMTLESFDVAAEALRREGIGLRVFVLLGVPFVPRRTQLKWMLRSVEHAAARDAEVVSIIPVRGGNGTLDTLEQTGDWRQVTLDDVEEALSLALTVAGPAIQIDLWDLDRLARCRHCAAGRRERLVDMNRAGSPLPRARCAFCEPGAPR